MQESGGMNTRHQILRFLMPLSITAGFVSASSNTKIGLNMENNLAKNLKDAILLYKLSYTNATQ